MLWWGYASQEESWHGYCSTKIPNGVEFSDGRGKQHKERFFKRIVEFGEAKERETEKKHASFVKKIKSTNITYGNNNFVKEFLGCLFCQLILQSVSRLVGQSINWLVVWLVGCMVKIILIILYQTIYICLSVLCFDT